MDENSGFLIVSYWIHTHCHVPHASSLLVWWLSDATILSFLDSHTYDLKLPPWIFLEDCIWLQPQDLPPWGKHFTSFYLFQKFAPANKHFLPNASSISSVSSSRSLVLFLERNARKDRGNFTSYTWGRRAQSQLLAWIWKRVKEKNRWEKNVNYISKCYSAPFWFLVYFSDLWFYWV